jgi:hypothetical protein
MVDAPECADDIELDDDAPRTWEQLDVATREKVIEKNRDWNVSYEWWDFTYKDATRMGEILGIRVDQINFSGFWSQGDGACFIGRYDHKVDAAQAIRAEAGDEGLHRIADALTLLQMTLKLEHGCIASGTITKSGRYCHSGCMDFELEIDLQDGDLGFDGDALSNELRRLMRDFADWTYKQLEAEHEYLTSDEAIIEAIKDNDYLFDSEGSII